MGSINKFPLFLPGISKDSNNNVSIIALDLREENTNIGFYVTDNKKVLLKTEAQYKTKNFDSISAIIDQFIKEYSLQDVTRVSVGVPCPVIDGKGYSERLPWLVDAQEIKDKTGISTVYLINDLEASAYGLADLSDECLVSIYETEKMPKGNVAVLAPGNGLGEAGLFYDGETLRPFATEGGHSEFSPRTQVEVEFYQFLNKIYGIVSWESVLSKTGLFNIFRFLRDEKRHPQSEKLSQRLREGEFCEMLYLSAVEDNETISSIAINTYLEFLAREANNLVLKLKATGGLLIGGYLPNLFKDYMDKERFYQKFRISDKMELLLKDIPLYLVVSEKTVITGAAYYAAFSK